MRYKCAVYMYQFITSSPLHIVIVTIIIISNTISAEISGKNSLLSSLLLSVLLLLHFLLFLFLLFFFFLFFFLSPLPLLHFNTHFFHNLHVILSSSSLSFTYLAWVLCIFSIERYRYLVCASSPPPSLSCSASHSIPSLLPFTYPLGDQQAHPHPL